MLQYGSPPSQSKNLDLRYTNMLFKMPWLFNTTGSHCKPPLLVPAVQNLPLNMHCHALRVAYPPFSIMKLGTSLLIYSQVCSDVCIEPDLQPAGGEELSGSSSNTQDAARLDIAANGFWGGHFECIFDVRIFNPHAPSNRTLHCYRKHELEKKCQYEQQVRDRTCFVYSSCLVSNRWYDQRSNSSFYKRLASCWFFHPVSSLMHMNVFVLLKQSKCIPTTCTCTYGMV